MYVALPHPDTDAQKHNATHTRTHSCAHTHTHTHSRSLSLSRSLCFLGDVIHHQNFLLHVAGLHSRTQARSLKGLPVAQKCVFFGLLIMWLLRVIPEKVRSFGLKVSGFGSLSPDTLARSTLHASNCEYLTPGGKRTWKATQNAAQDQRLRNNTPKIRELAYTDTRP